MPAMNKTEGKLTGWWYLYRARTVVESQAESQNRSSEIMILYFAIMVLVGGTAIGVEGHCK